MPSLFLSIFSFPLIPITQVLKSCFRTELLLYILSKFIVSPYYKEEERRSKTMTYQSQLNRKNNGSDSKSTVVNGKAAAVFDGLQIGPI